ncbi:MAG: hypothetical protein ACTHQ3_10665 [Motilibacteraceae bacterium]
MSEEPFEDQAIDAPIDQQGEADLLDAADPHDGSDAGRTEVIPTGEDRVDAALERLPELDRLPTAEHVAVYEEVHRSLQDALGAAAGGSGGAGSASASASASASPRPAVPGPQRR